MALNKRIDQLATTSPTNADEMPLWDSSLSGTRKITFAQLAAFIGSSPTGTTQRLTFSNASGATINSSTIIGKTVLLITRGGIEAGDIIASGTPTSEEILFNTTTGDLTFGNPLVGERVVVLYV